MTKRPLTLLEVAIGLALTAILLTTLFSSFRQMIQINSQVRMLSESLHPHFVMRLRLNQVFGRIYPGDKLTLEKDRGDGSAFKFQFNNGIDHSTDFAGEVEGQLLLDDKKQFCLLLKKKDKERKEVLLQGVRDVCFEVFDPAKKSWESELDEKQPLPPMVRFGIDGREYTLFLPRTEHKVGYP